MNYLNNIRIGLRIVLLAVAAFFAHQSAFAFASGDVEYSLDNGNMTAVVTKYNGSASSVSIPSLIDVPEQYKGEDGEWHTRYKVFTVVGIGEKAFQGNATITSVELPSSVWYTSSYSFADCTSLTSFPFDGITSYGKFSFMNCSALKSVVTSSRTTYYGLGVFHGCTSLLSAEINGNGNCTISIYGDDGLFRDCSSLEVCRLGDGIKEVTCSGIWGYRNPNAMFSGCDAIREVYFDGLEELGNASLQGKTSLEICRFPFAKRIGDNMFRGCSNLTEITPLDNITSIGANAFNGCSSLPGAINLPKIESIGSYAFNNCSSITSVTTSDKVGNYPVGVFQGCASLLSAEINGNGNCTISTYGDDGLFRGCSSLEVCRLGDGIKEITCSGIWGYRNPNAMFSGCDAIREVYFDGLEELGNGSLQGKTSLEICRFPSAKRIGDNMFRGCSNLTEITPFGNMTSIGANAFNGCSSLFGAMSLPAATSIGDYAFNGCIGINEVVMSKNLSSIGRGVFYGCSALHRVEIDGDGKLAIQGDLVDWGGHYSAGTFCNCTGLEECIFGEGIKSIGKNAFDGCTNAFDFVFLGKPVEADNNAFKGVKSGAVGYYTAEHKTEWEDVIPSSGLWKRLIMKPAKQPKLEIQSVDWINGSIQLDWSNTENCEEVNWPCTLYRGTTENFADAKPIAANLTETSYSDAEFLTAEPVTAPLYYWVVPENGDISCAASLPISTRHRYGIFVGVESFENGWKDDLSDFKNDTEAVRDLFAHFGYVDKNSLATPSSRDLSRAITDLAANCRKGDMAAIWIFTHGGSTRKNSELSKGISWLCMTPKNDRYFSEQMALDLANFDKDVVVTPIIYACHAGGMIETAQGIIDALGAEDYITSASMQCGASLGFVASISKAISYPATNTHGKESPFVRFMVDGATNATDKDFDGRLSMDELFDYVAMQQQRFVPVAEVQKPNELILQKVLLEGSYNANDSEGESKPQAPTNLRTIQNSADGSVSVVWDAAVGAKWYSIQCTAMNSDRKREILRCDLTYEPSRFFSANMLKLTSFQLTYSDYIFNVCSGNEFGESEAIQIGYTPPSFCIIVNVKASNDRMSEIEVSWDVTGRQNIDSFALTRRQMSWGGIGVDAGATSIFDYILDANMNPTNLYYVDKTAYVGDIFAMYQYKVEAIRDGQVVASKYSPYTTCQRSPTLKVDEVAPISGKAQIYHLDVDSNTKITWHYDDVEFCTPLCVFTKGTTTSFYFAFKENPSEESRKYRFQVWAWVDDEVVLQEERVIVQLGASHLDSDNDQNCIPSNRTLLRLLEDDGIVIDAGQVVEVVEAEDDGGVKPELTLSGEGTVEFATKTSAPSSIVSFADNWTGTLVVDWSMDGDETKGYDFNKWGITGSTIDIALPFTGYPFMNATIEPAIWLSAPLTINDGWKDTTTTFTEISGYGDMTVSGIASNVGDRYYRIKTLANYSGSLSSGEWGNGVFIIDDIATTNAVTYGVPIVKGATVLSVKDIDKTTINGEEANLCVGIGGIYLSAAATVADDGTTTGYATVREALENANEMGIRKVVVYDVEAQELAESWEQWALDGNIFTSTRPVATVGGVTYASLESAIDAAVAEQATEIVLINSTSEVVTIPAGITVAVSDGASFTGKLSGGGAIRFTKKPSKFSAENLEKGENGWMGTFIADWDTYLKSGFELHNYGIAGSTVEIVGSMVGWLGESGYVIDNVAPTLKITGSLKINDGSSRLECRLSHVTGTGALTFDTDKYYSIEALEDWHGTLIVSNSNTWVTNIVSGAGRIVVAEKPQTNMTFGESWSGTFIADFDLLNSEYQIAPNNYGGLGSTVIVSKPIEDGYFVADWNAAEPLLIAPSIYLKANVKIADGYSDPDNVTTFTELGADAGVVFTTRQGNSRGTYYNVNRLRNFAGSIVLRDYSKMRIQEIALDAMPSVGDCLLQATISETGAEFLDIESTKITVGGIEQAVFLKVTQDGIVVDDPSAYIHVLGDEDAAIEYDAVYGCVVKPSGVEKEIVVTMPPSIDASKVTVEVSTSVERITLNGAGVKVVSGGHDITDYLVIPPSEGGMVSVGAAELDAIKVFEETIAGDNKKSIESVLDAALSSDTTSEATIHSAKPGLYYSMEASSDIVFPEDVVKTKVGEATMATSSTVNISKPDKPIGNTVFYRIKVSKSAD